MRTIFSLFILGCIALILTLPLSAGTASQARALVRAYDISFKDWVSKVDFEMWKRIDPGTSTDMMGGEYMREVKEEVRQEMSRDADLMKVKAKLAERTEKQDPLNS